MQMAMIIIHKINNNIKLNTNLYSELNIYLFNFIKYIDCIFIIL